MKPNLKVYLIQVLVLLFNKYESITSVYSSAPYGAKPQPYVPAPPGERPPCAKNGFTYCEYPQHYPSDLVTELLENWKFDHGSLLRNESPKEYFYVASDSYGPYPKPVYGPPTPTPEPSNQHIPNYPYPDRNPNAYIPPPSSIYPHNHTFYPYPSPQIPGIDSFKNKFNHFQNTYQQPSQYPSYFKTLQPPELGRFTQNPWSKWSDQKYYMRKKRSLIKRWINNELNATSTMLLGDVPETKSRKKRQNDSQPEKLCQTFVNYIMPRAAMNNKGDWMYIVNMAENDGKNSQLVKTETCRSTDCNGLCNLPDGYSSKCEQRFIQKRLVALEPGGSNLYTDVFWFPSCCICALISPP